MNHGLKPYKHYPENTHSLKKLHRHLGGVFPTTYPRVAFQVGVPLNIRNQGDDMTCTSRAIAALTEYITGIPMAEEWQWMQTAKVNGIDPAILIAEGVDLGTAFNVPLMVGELERKDCPVSFDKDGIDKVTDPKSYDPITAYAALNHRFIKIKADTYPGAKDRFDSIVLTMLAHKVGVVFGAVFDTSWLGQTYIDIPSNGGGHAMPSFKYVPVGDKDYIAIQQSAGTGVGEGGIQYFSREVVNANPELGALAEIPVSPEVANAMAKQTIFSKLSSLLSQLFIALMFWRK